MRQRWKTDGNGNRGFGPLVGQRENAGCQCGVSGLSTKEGRGNGVAPASRAVMMGRGFRKAVKVKVAVVWGEEGGRGRWSQERTCDDAYSGVWVATCIGKDIRGWVACMAIG